jgi:hypothetical protein
VKAVDHTTVDNTRFIQGLLTSEKPLVHQFRCYRSGPQARRVQKRLVRSCRCSLLPVLATGCEKTLRGPLSSRMRTEDLFPIASIHQPGRVGIMTILYDYTSSIRFSAAFSEKSARDFSQLPRDQFAKKNFWRKCFQQKILNPVLFHNVSAQNPAAGRNSGSDYYWHMVCENP